MLRLLWLLFLSVLTISASPKGERRRTLEQDLKLIQQDDLRQGMEEEQDSYQEQLERKRKKLQQSERSKDLPTQI
jgi:hypothetical protein